MYDNIGGKIKGLAKGTFIVEAIAAIIIGIAMLADGDEDLMIVGALTLICGPIVAWISSWVLYAFGQIVEDVRAIRNKEGTTDEVNAKRAAEEKAAFDFSVNRHNGTSQGTDATNSSRGNPNDFEINAAWQNSIKQMSTEKLYKRYDDINYSETYRYMCALELKERGVNIEDAPKA